MDKVIIIRYGEIHLKGRNRGFFEDLLVSNIRHAIKIFGAKLEHISGRYIVSSFDSNDENKVINALMKVAGIVSISPSFAVSQTLEDITSAALVLAREINLTFKVETNRANKSFPLNSLEVSREVGGAVLEKFPSLKVNVTNPASVINIDIRENAKTYVYSKVFHGVGGMPVGSAGEGLLLLSGGIDSPVAGYMMAKRGVKIAGLHFHSYPYTSPEAKEKVISLAKKISDFSGKMRLFIVSVTKIQEEIHAKCNPEFMITILRRFMFKIAEIIAHKEGFKMIITGESLGQVASQTIESMTVVESVVKSLPVLRPLIAFDKNETIDIARKIETYETSILPYEDCCTVFLPKNPQTKPRIERVIFEESKIDVDALINAALSSIEVIEI